MWLPLGNILKRSIAARPMTSALDTAMVAEGVLATVIAVFPNHGNRVRVSAIKNGILHLASAYRPALQELTMGKRKLLQACKERQLPIREIRVGPDFVAAKYPEQEPDLEI